MTASDTSPSILSSNLFPAAEVLQSTTSLMRFGSTPSIDRILMTSSTGHQPSLSIFLLKKGSWRSSLAKFFEIRSNSGLWRSIIIITITKCLPPTLAAALFKAAADAVKLRWGV